MKECCGNCKFWKELKHSFEVGKGFKESHCCVLYAYYEHISEDYFIIETDENDTCEAFRLKEE